MFSKYFWRLLVLRIITSITFKKADGIIFLSNYARQQVELVVNIAKLKKIILSSGEMSQSYDLVAGKTVKSSNPFGRLFENICQFFKGFLS